MIAMAGATDPDSGARITRTATAAGVVASALVLLGWMFDITTFKSITPGSVTMKPNAALGLLLSSLALWMLCARSAGRSSRTLASALATLSVLLGGATLVEYLTGADLGIDELLLRDDPAPLHTAARGRMSFPLAAILVVLGVATLALGSARETGSRRSPSAAKAERFATVHAPLTIGVAAVIGLLDHSLGPLGWMASTVMAWHTAALALALAVGLFFARPKARTALAERRAPTAVLLGGLLVTTTGVAFALVHVAKTNALRFEDAARDATRALVHRMDVHMTVLVATRGMFAGGRRPDRKAFAEHASSLRALAGYEAFQGLGYIEVIPPGSLAAHEDAVRREGLSDYRVFPEGDRPPASAVVLLEPPDDRSWRVIGSDMTRVPVRSAAMDRARETGEPALSGKVSLMQEGGGTAPGFLVFVPVYAGAGSPTSEAEREASIRGWVFGPLTGSRFFEPVHDATSGRKVNFAVFDDESPSPEALLYQSSSGPSPRPWIGGAPAERQLSVTIAGRTWTLQFWPGPMLEAESPARIPVYVAVTGLILTALMFAFTRGEVRARLAAEASVKARDEFLSIASHELKTPLTPLLLLAQSLAYTPVKSPEKARSKAASIERAIRRLSRLIDALLDVSNVAAGKLSLTPEALDLAKLAREVVDRMKDEAAQAGASIELQAGEPVLGRWDRLRLDQVLTNLVSNAIKYGRGKPIEVFVTSGAEGAVVRVRDQGIGIAPGDVARIFGRFDRASAPEGYGGFGLGLWLVQHFVEVSGGRIEVESEVGVGSTFTVTLPYST